MIWNLEPNKTQKVADLVLNNLEERFYGRRPAQPNKASAMFSLEEQLQTRSRVAPGERQPNPGKQRWFSGR